MLETVAISRFVKSLQLVCLPLSASSCYLCRGFCPMRWIIASSRIFDVSGMSTGVVVRPKPAARMFTNLGGSGRGSQSGRTVSERSMIIVTDEMVTAAAVPAKQKRARARRPDAERRVRINRTGKRKEWSKYSGGFSLRPRIMTHSVNEALSKLRG